MSIEIRTEGRRHYLIGNTYPLRDQLRNAGAHWDGERKAWWTSKRDVAESIVGAGAASSESADGDKIATDARVIRGRATYEGKTYYVLAHGQSRTTGKPYAKLAFRDGSRVFWAKDAAAVQIVKVYDEPTSIDALRRFAERRRKEDRGEVECSLCARYCTCGQGFCQHHHDGCDRCGEER